MEIIERACSSEGAPLDIFDRAAWDIKDAMNAAGFGPAFDGALQDELLLELGTTLGVYTFHESEQDVVPLLLGIVHRFTVSVGLDSYTIVTRGGIHTVRTATSLQDVFDELGDTPPDDISSIEVEDPYYEHVRRTLLYQGGTLKVVCLATDSPSILGEEVS